MNKINKVMKYSIPKEHLHPTMTLNDAIFIGFTDDPYSYSVFVESVYIDSGDNGVYVQGPIFDSTMSFGPYTGKDEMKWPSEIENLVVTISDDFKVINADLDNYRIRLTDDKIGKDNHIFVRNPTIIDFTDDKLIIEGEVFWFDKVVSGYGVDAIPFLNENYPY